MTWIVSSLTTNEIRITSSDITLLNNVDYSNIWRFIDNLVQITSITEDYINSLINTTIQNKINQIISVDTIFSYDGGYLNNSLQIISSTTDYLWYFGKLLQQSNYRSLFNEINYSYTYDRIISTEYFYI